ncbi:hypothetical protein [Kocuria atrinae]|uniref:hypothetical protein n=1 Tax=Kocuria atrinae TaxID=592377 RepID=UPI0031DDA3DA
MSSTERTSVNPAPWQNSAGNGNRVDQAATGDNSAGRLSADDTKPAVADPAVANSVDEPAAANDATETGAASARPTSLSSVLTTVITGLLIGSVATVMHANIWYVNESVWLPWGLLFSGALVWFASVWCGTATRRVWGAAVPGLLTYVLSWAYAYLKNGSALVVTSWDAPIGMVGYAWFAVIFVAVMAAVIMTGRYIVRLRRQARR